jgi:predicted nucleotidyltransferase
MLEKIFTSATRVRVMELFLANQDKQFYLREISKKLDENTNAVRRELNNLHDIGLLRKERKGNLVLYSVNRNFPIYNELKNIFMKTRGVAKVMADSIQNMKGVKIAFIYGSFARGDERVSSDVDLFIVGEPEEGILLKELKRLEGVLGREINYVVFTPNEFKEGNPFIKEVLTKPKIMLVGDFNDNR